VGHYSLHVCSGLILKNYTSLETLAYFAAASVTKKEVLKIWHLVEALAGTAGRVVKM
jgi:hypothetical protein